MMYQADEKRYETMQYNRCGKSGLLLPKVSLGLWHNFGSNGDYDNMKAMCFTAFDHGITHFDLANNYGPEPGSAETNFGRILKEDLGAYRDEMLISTKAGFDIDMLNAVCSAVNIPVIASGGCGKINDFAEVFEKTNSSAALAASLFHFRELTVGQVKSYLKERNFPVR